MQTITHEEREILQLFCTTDIENIKLAEQLSSSINQTLYKILKKGCYFDLGIVNMFNDLEEISIMDSRIIRIDGDEQMTFFQKMLDEKLPLPNNVCILHIFNCNETVRISNLPNNVRSLHFATCHKIEISKLPNTLVALAFINSDLKIYPTVFPAQLDELIIESTVFTPFPAMLPANLRSLTLSDTGLTSLPPLPNSISYLYINKHNLKDAPNDLPKALTYLDIRGTRFYGKKLDVNLLIAERPNLTIRCGSLE
jgi:Leucine-rich repeat (LRR) protein